MTFFTNLFISVDTALVALYLTQIAVVMQYVAPILFVLGIVLIIGTGITVSQGWTQQPAKPILLAAATLTFVTILAGNLAQYNLFIADFLRGMPDELIALTSITQGGVGGALDTFGAAVLEGTREIRRNASGFSNTIGAWAVTILLWVVWAIMSVAAAFVLILAKVVLTILVIVGPLFLLFLLFPQTKDYFSKWLSYSFSFAILAMFIGGIIAATQGIAAGYFDAFSQSDGNIDLAEFTGPLVIIFGLYRLFDSAPSFASSVAGGIGLSVGGGIAGVGSRLSAPLRRAGTVAASAGFRNIRENRQVKKQVRFNEKIDRAGKK